MNTQDNLESYRWTDESLPLETRRCLLQRDLQNSANRRQSRGQGDMQAKAKAAGEGRPFDSQRAASRQPPDAGPDRIR
jgi:hypothetical protein